MYSSIVKTKTRPGDYLAIIGAGGGLGHMYIYTTSQAKTYWLLKILHVGESKLLSRKVSRLLQLTGEQYLQITLPFRHQTNIMAIQSGDKKKQLCLSLGATEYLDYREVDVVQTIKTKIGFCVHAVICTANGERAYEQSMQMLRPLGTLVCVGIPSTPFKLPATPFDMIVKGEY
jgi:propanol-preferring alcohol dehydrogenase